MTSWACRVACFTSFLGFVLRRLRLIVRIPGVRVFVFSHDKMWQAEVSKSSVKFAAAPVHRSEAEF